MAMLNNQRLTELIDQLMPGGGNHRLVVFLWRIFGELSTMGPVMLLGVCPGSTCGLDSAGQTFGFWGGMILLHLISCINGLV